ncbi:MAG: hypothetical protein FWC76_05600 [Defluviitaleaceae bacterium]|nr:hypothetical protein [Defluviitaleaceae bacterium]
MHKRSVFFGVGIGILVMVVVAFGTYIVQRAAHTSETNRLVALLEEHYHIVPSEVDYDYVIDRAREFGMVFPAEIETPVDVEPINAQNDQTDHETIDEPIADEEPVEELIEEPEPTPTPAPREYIRMTISAGISAARAAPYFEASGLVENAEDFLEFLINNGYEHSIRAGVFSIPEGASYHEIVNIIVHGN